MTESTICSLIQTFPVLLILAQNHNRCLKTPFIYKPPTPTHSPEYNEALDALFHNIFGHGYHGDHPGSYGHEQGYPGYYGQGCGRHYDKNINIKPHDDHHGPCFDYGYSGPDYGLGTGYGYGYGQGSGHGYGSYGYLQGSPTYGYKKVNMYNISSGHGYKGTYAPSQVYNVNHKYKIVVRKNKHGHPRRRFQKLKTEESCLTVEGGSGSCISILDCEPFIKLLQQSRSDPRIVQVLRKAHCGFEGHNPKVCCPLPGFPTVPPSTTTTPAPVTTEVMQPKSADYISSLPEPPVCGFSNASFSRVVGGEDAQLGDFPWMALLGYKRKSGDTGWLCGGSLVTSKHVLTASHCIHGHETTLYVVRLGELDLSRTDEGATPIDVLIKEQIKHEEYSPNSFTNDIALLVLARVVQFTDLIKPICLPRSSELRSNNFENYNPFIAGWGDLQFRGPKSDKLQVLQLPVLTNEYCVQAYSAYKAQKIDERVLCAGFKNGGKDACQGDSGGPLMQTIWNKDTLKTYFYQIGVVSFGKKCAEAGFPGVYTRVTNFMPWLESKITNSS